MKYYYILLFILAPFFVNAQDVFMQDGTFNRCAPDKLYDSGGPTGPYSSNEDIVTTICPIDTANGEFIILDFLAFSTQLNVDELTIYDGSDTSAPVINSYNGATNPGTVIATNPDGCLTLRFVTNGSGTTTGYEADIICAVPCQDIDPFLVSSTPEANSAGVIQIVSGDTVDFVGNANFSVDGTGATYEWNFGDGSPEETGETVSHQFIGEGEYSVTLIVTDDNPLGCSETLTIPVFVVGPNIVVDQDIFTVEELVLDVLIDSECAEVSNITFDTGINYGQANGIGYFSNDGSDFPFTDGLLLVTGDAEDAEGPNVNNISSGTGGWPGDAFLNTLTGENTNNATQIQFDFVPLADSISFDFLMASEEYDGGTGGTFECTFSDAFAFLLTDSDNNTTNLAVVPGTNTPILVTNIHPDNSGCDAVNEEFFGEYVLPGQTPMSFDGRTGVFTAQANVTPGETYTIRLVIADARDSAFDSGVFLEAGSFDLGGNLGDDITIAAGNATCGGTAQVLDTGVSTATHTWFLDGAEIPGETGSVLNATEPGVYSVDVFLSATCQFTDEIVVEFKPSPEANEPDDLTECVNGTSAPFDLDLNDDVILGGQNPDDFVITYHLNELDAQNNANPLPVPYTNTSNPQTIWSRIADTTQECFVVDSFDIGFTGLDINENIEPLTICDTNADGFGSFVLTDSDAQALDGLDTTQFSVSYHLTQDDADNNLSPLASPYTNTTINQQTIFIRVGRNDDVNCFNTAELELIVNEQPIAIAPTPLEACDDDTDGFTQFDLSLRTAEIINGQADVSVVYYGSLDDATNAQNPLPINFTNTVAGSQIIFARLTNDLSACFSIAELVLVVNEKPTVPEITEFSLCDENLPGADIEGFDLTLKDAEILNGEPNLVVTYHTSESDAESGTDPITGLFNNTSNPQTIFVNLRNTLTTCSSVGSFQLIVNPLPTITEPVPFDLCDDDVTDGITLFDLESITDGITGENPSYVTTYHLTQADAISNVSPLSSPYQNITNGQTIFVRVEEQINNCFVFTELVLNVNPNPVANTPDPINVCDGNNDGFAEFDLASRTSDIIGSSLNTSVSYHLSLEDAESGDNPLPTSFTNTQPSAQVIFARLQDDTTFCFDIVELNLIVDASPVFPNIAALTLCDDNLPGDEIESFDLLSLDDAISGGFANFNVSYHVSLDDAENGVSPLSSPYNNIANPQTIFFNLTNTTTGCSSVGNFELIVNTLPLANIPTPLEVCDDGTPDGITMIDLELKDSEITGGNPLYSVSYHLSEADALSDVSPLSVPYENQSNGQTVFARVVDSGTGCVIVVPLVLQVQQAPVANA
ncbi:MAG: choice-of-anchor L domain-containing protein, partial [Bacteroidota bacterium]